MTDKLPPQLYVLFLPCLNLAAPHNHHTFKDRILANCLSLQLFAPRPALRYLPPSDHAPGDRRTHNIDGVAAFLQQVKEEQWDDHYQPTESWLQKKDRQKLETLEAATYRTTEGYKNDYNPHQDPNIKGDPLKTLFVGRLSYNVDKRDLEREFGRYGPISDVHLPLSKSSNPPRLKPT